MKRIGWLAGVVVVFAIAVLVRVQMIAAEQKQVKEGVETIQRRQGYPVELVPIRKGAFSVWREVHGMLMGSAESHIRTADPARIKSIDCQIGDLVTADTPLITLDSDDPRNLTRVRLARQVYEDAKSDYEKFQRLADQDLMAKDNVDKARLRMDAAKTDYDLALTAVSLSSSIDGVVTALNARVGERADKDTDLAVVSAVDPIRFTSSISDTDAAAIKPGQSARARTPEGGTESGKVERVSLRAEPRNSMFGLEIALENSARALKIGTYATAEVEVIHLEDALFVDYRCLLTDPSGAAYLFQVKDGLAKKVVVKVIAANQDFAAIEGEGLDPALPVVLHGRELLQDGVKVRLVEGEGGQ